MAAAYRNLWVWIISASVLLNGVYCTCAGAGARGRAFAQCAAGPRSCCSENDAPDSHHVAGLRTSNDHRKPAGHQVSCAHCTGALASQRSHTPDIQPPLNAMPFAVHFAGCVLRFNTHSAWPHLFDAAAQFPTDGATLLRLHCALLV